MSALISSFSSRWCTPFTLPTVPTGIKIGVSITPCAVVILPARAFVSSSVFSMSKFIEVYYEGAKVRNNYQFTINKLHFALQKLSKGIYE